jgi:uncharacterized protein YggE
MDGEVRMVKRIALIVGAFALLVPVGLAGLWVWGQMESSAVAQTSEGTSGYNPAQTITVVGQGSIQIEPDVARVSIGVETSAESVGTAVEQNEAKMALILAALEEVGMAALEEVGIAEKDIQTMHYSVQLERYPEPVPRAVGDEPGEPRPQYRVSNMANVTVRNMAKVGEVLDAVIEAGANNIWGVSFGLEDPAAAQADARSKAIADAEARAEALAELSGVNLGPVMSISEVLGGGVVPTPVLSVERAASGAGPISPGEVEVGYQVQVVFFIEP